MKFDLIQKYYNYERILSNLFFNPSNRQFQQYQFLFRMGQSNINQKIMKKEQLSKELQPIDLAKGIYINLCNNRQYVRNDVIVGNIEDIENEIDIYLFRRINDCYVVSVDYCTNLSVEGSQNFSKFSYFIEKKNSTLFQKYQCKIEEGIEILLHVIKGFHILYQRFGYFTPYSQLIYFNHLNQPKVWINQDLKITKNVQNPQNPKSVMLQNKFVREIVHLFDILRDPDNPMVRYTQFLPNNILTFKLFAQILTKKKIEQSYLPIRRQKLYNKNHNLLSINQDQNQQLSNIREPYHYHSYQFYQSSPNHSQMASPIGSPHQAISPTSIIHPQNQQNIHLNFSYISPQKSKKPQIEKQTTKINLQSQSFIKRYHRLEPQKQFTSTMPNSSRNSVIQRHLFVERHSHIPTQVLSRHSSNNMNPGNNLKKEANQRYSEIEQTSIGREIRQKNTEPNNLKISFLGPQINQNSQQQSINSMLSQKQQKYTQFRSSNKKTKLTNPRVEELPSKKGFGHKRHQTDINLRQLNNENSSQFDQLSMIDGNYLSKFNLNTIKSIQLLDEQKDADDEIIGDLKKLINKYHMRS